MKKAKILFIEDSTDLQEAVALSLSKEYEIHAAVDAEAALLMFDKVHYDLLIVDLGLPKMSGYKLCTIIRSQEKNSQVPIIIYSGSIDVEDKLMGFSLGANDYFAKPGDLRELKARIQIQLKKSNNNPVDRQILEIAPFHLNLITQSIYLKRDGSKKLMDLSSLEFRVLHFFMTHIDRVVSREQLLDQVWGNSRHVNDRSVDALISKLRHKLGDMSGLIQSVHGTGYRFINPSLITNDQFSVKKAG